MDLYCRWILVRPTPVQASSQTTRVFCLSVYYFAGYTKWGGLGVLPCILIGFVGSRRRIQGVYVWVAAVCRESLGGTGLCITLSFGLGVGLEGWSMVVTSGACPPVGGPTHPMSL